MCVRVPLHSLKTRDVHKNIFGYENKGKNPIKKWCAKKHVNLLLIGEKGKRDYVTIKDFNMFLYDHTLLLGIKKF